jgi:hypothetical protein
MDFRFGTSFTGEPVDQKKIKSFGRHKFTWLHIEKNLLFISGMVIEENDFSRVGHVKKSYFNLLTPRNENFASHQKAYLEALL